MLKISNILVGLKDDRDLVEIVETKVGIPKAEIKKIQVMNRSIDARKKHKILLSYTIAVEGKHGDEGLKKKIKPGFGVSSYELKETTFAMESGDKKMSHRPVIVGMGPAGIFAALYLARAGYRPIVLERGKSVEERSRDVANFWNGSSKLLKNSNVQFGEGGAGTFSDGKLTTRSKDPRIFQVLTELVKAGAPEEILYHYKPHVGTDILRKVLISIRKELLSLGADIFFEEQLTEIKIVDAKMTEIGTSTGRILPVENLVLAVGHSARDTYRMLHGSGIALEEKAFAVGLRIEHPQEWLDQAQYGSFAGHPKLGSADYMMTHHSTCGRGVYTFCMCPGGEVVASTSEEEGVVTNGMSYYSRSSGIANSAIVATVNPSDWNHTPLGGMEFQRSLEKKAYELGGRNYYAPFQLVGDFLGSPGKSKPLLTPSYRPGVAEADLRTALPEEIVKSLQEGICGFGRKIVGFDHEGAVLTGIETRTSSPVRISRGDTGQSISCQGLYPCGEGAGYAGGIISAAMDGIKQAENIIKEYKPF